MSDVNLENYLRSMIALLAKHFPVGDARRGEVDDPRARGWVQVNVAVPDVRVVIQALDSGDVKAKFDSQAPSTLRRFRHRIMTLSPYMLDWFTIGDDEVVTMAGFRWTPSEADGREDPAADDRIQRIKLLLIEHGPAAGLVLIPPDERRDEASL